MKMPLGVVVNVIDSYMDGQGTMEARLLGIFPIVRMHGTEDIALGEMMRWLPECVLYPTSLLVPPKSMTARAGGGLEWIPSKVANAATAQLTDSRTGLVAQMTFQFDPANGLVSSIQGERPMAVGNDRSVLGKWEGLCLDYQEHDGMLLPTQMLGGWWKEGKLELYFKGKNTSFDFTYSS